MVGDKPKYELHFHASVPSAVVQDYKNVTQLFQESLAQLAVVPLHQLPADLTDFTGRQDELEQVMAWLQPIPASANSPSRTQKAIAVITGMAGVGKSVLAIHAAHQLMSSFPDAQLYVNLHGSDSQPLEPTEVLVGFLRALGVNDQSIPEDLTERVKLYRSLLSDKRALVLLDNAHDEAQIRPLVPNNSSCAVLITSRRRLATLEEVTCLDLGVMKESEALELLQRLIGGERIQSELEAAKTIIDLCGRSPLAIRMTGGILQSRLQWRLEEYTHQLAIERQRIAQLRLNNLDVRSSFASSCEQLDASSSRLFRFLGLLRGTNFSPTIATALLETESATALAALNSLVQAQLLESASMGRYRLHDLVRLFAKEQLAQEEPTEARQAARLRAARWYLEASKMMNLALKSETRHPLAQALVQGNNQSLEVTEQNWFSGALNWFQLERINLLASLEWAYQAQAWDIVVSLAHNLVNFFNTYAHHADWERTHLLALEASRKLAASSDTNTAASQQGEAQTLTNLGNVYALQNEWEKSRDCYEQSLVLFSDLGNHIEVAKAMGNLANIYFQLSNWDKAKEYYEQSLILFSELGEHYAEAQTLANMGILQLKQNHEEEAGVLWQQALQKLSPDLPKSQRLVEWLNSIEKPNSLASEKTPDMVSSGEVHRITTPEKLAEAANPSEPLQPLADTTLVQENGVASQEYNNNHPQRRRFYVFAIVIFGFAIALLIRLVMR